MRNAASRRYDQQSMTDQQDPTRQRDPLSWVDGLGLVAIATLTFGAGWNWGIGWAMITVGGLVGAVYVMLEIVLAARPRRNRS